MELGGQPPKRVCLEGSRGHVADGGVAATAIVEHLDPLEDGLLGGAAGAPDAVMEQLTLEGSEEALCDGVVAGIAATAHRDGNAVGVQEGAIIRRGVLTTAVGVMDQVAAEWAALLQGHTQGLQV